MMQALPFLKMNGVELKNQRVIIREDLNVPMDDNGKITSYERIERALPSLRYALAQGARVIVLSHLGRPKEGEFETKYSLAPVAEALQKALNQDVRLVKDWMDGVTVEPGQLILGENVRFYAGETQNDVALAKRMAKQCDVFVMDAFATAHRAHASTVGIADFAPIACAGPLLTEEVLALSKAFEKPKHPITAIVGGSKVSTKIQLLRNLLEKVDQLIVGGGIANTFLAAAGYFIGKSLYEADWLDETKKLLKEAQLRNIKIPLPEDVRVAKTFAKEETAIIRSIQDVQADDMILDVGPKTSAHYAPLLEQSGTIIWNGPIGVFEFPAFQQGTKAVADAIAKSAAYSIAGGGDTLSALEIFGIRDRVSYASTGGGAFLEYIEGKPLPGISVLTKRSREKVL
jgi:phosphoglycerate kinase